MRSFSEFRSLMVMTVGVIVFTFASAAEAQFCNCGQPVGVYGICDVAGLNAVRSQMSRSFVLCQDIDEVGPFVPLGREGGTWRTFQGTFDGRGHTIRGAEIDESALGSWNWNGAALFVDLGAGSVVKDLTLEGFSVRTYELGAPLAGKAQGLIENCHVRATSVVGTKYTRPGPGYLAGLVVANLGVIRASSIDPTVQITGAITPGRIGGLAAESSGTIEDCEVEVDLHGAYWTGGLVGDLKAGGLVRRCEVRGAVSALSNAGGIAAVMSSLDGYPASVVEEVVTDLVVEAGDAAGGVAGRSIRATRIERAIARGEILAAASGGGLVGKTSSYGGGAELRDSIFEGQLTCAGPCGGAVGLLEGPDRLANLVVTGLIAAGAVGGGGAGASTGTATLDAVFFDAELNPDLDEGAGAPMTTAALQDLVTYQAAGFDIALDTQAGSSTWIIPSSSQPGYPRLRWQSPVARGAPQLQTLTSAPTWEDQAWNYVLGYEVTAQRDGAITALGGYFGGERIVRLLDLDYNILAEAEVSSENAWRYVDIEPVAVAAGEQLLVVVYTAGAGGALFEMASQTTDDLVIGDMAYMYLPYGDEPTWRYTTSSAYGAPDLRFEATPVPEQVYAQEAGASPLGPYGWDYALGYAFTPTVDGVIEALGGRFRSPNAKTVKLFDEATRALIATAEVRSTDGTFQYTSIAPVSVEAGRTYVVAAYLEGDGGLYSYLGANPLPRAQGSVVIEQARFASTRSDPDAFPTYTTTTYLYGQPDVVFAASP